MPINITEEFVCNLIEQNAALIAQVANLSETVESLNQTIKDLQEQLNKITAIREALNGTPDIIFN